MRTHVRKMAEVSRIIGVCQEIWSHYSYPYIIRCGGVLEALGPALARKTVDKKTGGVTLACEGFNQKNHYDRETPCHILRKLARQRTLALREGRWR